MKRKPNASSATTDKSSMNLSAASLFEQGFDRRAFLKRLGAGIACPSLLSTLAACGDNNNKNVIVEPSSEFMDTGTNTPPNGNVNNPPVTGNGIPSVIPKPSAAYSALKRTSFGPRYDELQEVERLGVDSYLEQQLDYELIDDGDLEQQIQSRFPLAFQSPVQLLVGFPDNTLAVAKDLVAATLYRQLFSRKQLYEIMVDFWSDHFNIHLVNGLEPLLKPTDDKDVIRKHAMGNFRELLSASAHSPAMLFYLDNFLNQASAPNENYARELMELHTLGVDGGYTETDVKEVARCFTGWSIRFPDATDGEFGTFVFYPTIHDNGEKTVLQNRIAAGGGQSDAEQVLDILANHPSTARFIASKLCRRFISDEPDAATIDRVSAAFQASGGDIKACLRALFTSDAFLNQNDGKFIRPLEYFCGVLRALNTAQAYPPDNGTFYFFALSILGQIPFFWPTPDGYPDTQAYWASAGGLLNRWRLSFLSLANQLPEIDLFTIDYAAILDGASTFSTALDALTERFLLRPLSEQDRQILLDWFEAQYQQKVDTEIPAEALQVVASVVAATLISSAYFQLR